MREQIGNTVSCDNIGALHTVTKKSKQAQASSSNADLRRALREVNRRARNTYSLEHVKGHQDRTATAEDLSLEARLNVECDKMTKEAVRGSITRELRDKAQQLPLEKACVFIAGRKQTSDPKNGLKRQIGTVQAKACYTSRETRKGRMDAETFETITWNDAEAALEGTRKMFKTWYAKHGSGFCGLEYWTSKWEGNRDSRCPSCMKLNEMADHLSQCKNEARTAGFVDQLTLIEE